MTVLAQQKVHTELLKVFLTFAEFPSQEFDESQGQSVASILVISTLTNAFKRLLWRKPIISQMIEDDALYALFEALVIQRSNNLGGDPAELYIWKARYRQSILASQSSGFSIAMMNRVLTQLDF